MKTMSNKSDTKKVWKFFMDLDKELEYINKMNDLGYKLVCENFGFVFTFKKAEPGEYVTIVHGEKKENFSQISKVAIECGWEIIPHPMDGLSEILYLTGKKDEVGEFTTDRESKLKSYTLMHKKFKVISIVYYILLAAFYTFTIFTALILIPEGDYVYTIFYGVFSVLYTLLTIPLVKITRRYKKRINKLLNDSLIYE